MLQYENVLTTRPSTNCDFPSTAGVNRKGEFLFLNKQMKESLGTESGTPINYKSAFKVLQLDKVRQGGKKRTKIFPMSGNPFMAEVIVTDLNGDYLLFVRNVMSEIQ